MTVIRGRALIFWDPQASPGRARRKRDAIDTDQITPSDDCISESLERLDERWKAATGLPTHQLVGSGYCQVQIIIDAIEKAGTLNKDAVNAALAQVDLMTIRGRAKYDQFQFSGFPIALGQWFKVDTAAKWDFKVISSSHDFYPATAEPMYPMPYK